MAEETTQTTGKEGTKGQSTGAKALQAIASQEDFDKAIQARIARERAKIPTDYDELKAKAAKLAEFEESQKTEAQKAQERLDAAEKRAAELELKATRAEVAAAKGVPVELLSGSTQEELETAADKLIACKGEPAKGPVIPGQGTMPAAAHESADDWLRQMAKA